MNEREHAVLSLFYHEGNRELTPSFLAYRMRMSTRDATALLDKMVKHGTLDLDIDDDGKLLYRLPESERRLLSEQRMGQQPHRRPDSPAPKRPQGSPAQPSPDESGARPFLRQRPSSPRESTSGADATPGYSSQPKGQQAPASPIRTHRQSAQDGTDGSLYPMSSQAASGASSKRSHSPTTKAVTSQQVGYDEWYQDESGHTGQGMYSGAQGSTDHHPNHGPQRSPYGPATSTASRDQHNRYAPMPERQALAPYQSADRHPAPRFGPYPDRERIPVLAGALSLLVPGLGQFYNGEIGKGVMLLFSCLLLSFFLLFWIVWIWSVIDAYMVAEQSNQRRLSDDSPSPHPHLLPDQRPPTSTTNSNAA